MPSPLISKTGVGESNQVSKMYEYTHDLTRPPPEHQINRDMIMLVRSLLPISPVSSLTSRSRSMPSLGCSARNSRQTSELKYGTSNRYSRTRSVGPLKNSNCGSVTLSRCGQAMGHTFMTPSPVQFVS